MPNAIDLMSRREFLERCGISDSTERRGRQHDPCWPPHLRIGIRVYYRRQAVESWIALQELLAGQKTQPFTADHQRGQTPKPAPSTNEL